MSMTTIRKTMRAALVEPLPERPAVSTDEVPVPEPAPGWVIVQLMAAALNRLDAMRVARRAELTAPAILGSDGAGIVVAVGSGVDTGLLGSEVLISPSLWWGDSAAAPDDTYEILGLPTAGTHAELVAVPRVNVVPKPGFLTWEEAAALPLAGMTAWRALVTRGRLGPGETVVVGAASSGVGTFAVQIAAGLGAHVVALSSTDAKLEQALSLGAERAVLRNSDGLAERLVAETGGGADLAIDPTGALWQALLSALRPGGRLVSVGRMAAHQATVDVEDVYWKQVDILGSSMGSPDDFTDLVDHVSTARWRPVVDSVFSLDEVAGAYRRLDAPDRFGKVVLRLREAGSAVIRQSGDSPTPQARPTDNEGNLR